MRSLKQRESTLKEWNVSVIMRTYGHGEMELYFDFWVSWQPRMPDTHTPTDVLKNPSAPKTSVAPSKVSLIQAHLSRVAFSPQDCGYSPMRPCCHITLSVLPSPSYSLLSPPNLLEEGETLCSASTHTLAGLQEGGWSVIWGQQGVRRQAGVRSAVVYSVPPFLIHCFFQWILSAGHKRMDLGSFLFTV